MTLAALVAVAVLAAGALARAAHRCPGGTPWPGACPAGRAAGAGAGRPRRPLPAPPPRVAAALAEADLPCPPAWRGRRGSARWAPARWWPLVAGGPGLAGVALVGAGRRPGAGRPHPAGPGRRRHRTGAARRPGGGGPVAALGGVAPPGRRGGRPGRRRRRPGAGRRAVTGGGRGGPGREPGRRPGGGAPSAGPCRAFASAWPPCAWGRRPVAPRPGRSTVWRPRCGSGWPWPPSCGRCRPRPASRPSSSGWRPIGFGAFAAATDPRTAEFMLHTPAGLVLLVAGLDPRRPGLAVDAAPGQGGGVTEAPSSPGVVRRGAGRRLAAPPRPGADPGPGARRAGRRPDRAAARRAPPAPRWRRCSSGWAPASSAASAVRPARRPAGGSVSALVGRRRRPRRAAGGRPAGRAGRPGPFPAWAPAAGAAGTWPPSPPTCPTWSTSWCWRSGAGLTVRLAVAAVARRSPGPLGRRAGPGRPGGRPRPPPGRRPRRPPRASRRGHPAPGRRTDRLRALRRPAGGQPGAAGARGPGRPPPAGRGGRPQGPRQAALPPGQLHTPRLRPPHRGPAHRQRRPVAAPVSTRRTQGGATECSPSTSTCPPTSPPSPAAPARRAGSGLGRVRPGPAGGGGRRPAHRGLGHQVRPGRQAVRRGHERHHRQGQVSVVL